MSEVQPESPKPIEVVPQPQTVSPKQTEDLSDQVGGFLKSWKFKLGVVLAGIIAIGVGIFIFYYPYWIAMTGLTRWSEESGSQAIDCMMRDTDNNKYISCSARIDQKVFPLECGASLFNIGCRVSREEMVRQ